MHDFGIIQAMQTELLRKTRDQEALNSGARSLMGNSEADHGAIQETLEDVNQRWDTLNRGGNFVIYRIN